MSWLGRGAVGLLLMAVGLAALGFGLYHLTKTGTCASGGPYVSARPCPSGTGLHIAALIAGVFVFLAGGALFATRGRRAIDPGLPPSDDSLSSNPPPFSRSYGPR
jgi:uncharacterized membrane protein